MAGVGVSTTDRSALLIQRRFLGFGADGSRQLHSRPRQPTRLSPVSRDGEVVNGEFGEHDAKVVKDFGVMMFGPNSRCQRLKMLPHTRRNLWLRHFVVGFQGENARGALGFFEPLFEFAFGRARAKDQDFISRAKTRNDCVVVAREGRSSVFEPPGRRVGVVPQGQVDNSPQFQLRVRTANVCKSRRDG